MSPLQTVIIKQIRANITEPPSSKIIQNWSDDELVKRVFFNYQNEQASRLTQFGQTVMRFCFQSYEFDVPKELQAQHLIFLAKRNTMPYFYGNGKLVVYDKNFAIMLRLAGDVGTMMAVDTID